MPTFVAGEVVLASKLNAATARDWADWTPTLTNLTLGNGTQVARWIQIGKIAFGYYSLTFGSTSAMGSAPIISLPFTLAQTMPQRTPIGQTFLFDSGTENYMGATGWWTTTSISPQQFGAATKVTVVALNATSPFTWTTNDRLICHFQGEVA